MLNTLRSALLLAAAILPVSVYAQDLDAMTPEELLPLAQKEGQVVVFSLSSRIARVEAAFEAQYPGVDLVGVDLSSTKQIARVVAEQQAGVYAVDVLYLADTPIVYTDLLADGRIHNYMPPRVAGEIDPAMQQPLAVHRLSTKVLMYNEEANPNGSPVTNLWQLTTPDWKGRVVMVDPLQRGDYLDLMTEIVLRADEMATVYEAQFGKPIQLSSGNATAGHQFIADLFANDVVLLASTDDVNKAVGAKGQANPPVGFTSYSDRRDNDDEGWALQVANNVVPSNGIIFPAVLSYTAKTSNPAAARLAIDFLMGDDSNTGGDGFAPFYVAGDYATRKDIVSHPDAVPLADFKAWPIDAAKTATIRKEIGDLILQIQ